MATLPVSVVIPTLDRAASLKRALESAIPSGSDVPCEFIVIDGSSGNETREMLDGFRSQLPQGTVLRVERATDLGAAAQRNQGCALATQAAILLMDDDIILEDHCIQRMWSALLSDKDLGGVSATITNQGYSPPGFISRQVFAVLNGRRLASYAGRVIGPAVNFLPGEPEDASNVVPVEWLYTCLVLYRREALPTPPFGGHFTGYSMMEDLTLSVTVGRQWRLANVRSARLSHYSLPGAYKDDVAALSCMELVNRHYVMTRVLGRSSMRDYLRLVLWELFQVAACAAKRDMRHRLPGEVRGKFRGLVKLANHVD